MFQPFTAPEILRADRADFYKNTVQPAAIRAFVAAAKRGDTVAERVAAIEAEVAKWQPFLDLCQLRWKDGVRAPAWRAWSEAHRTVLRGEYLLRTNGGGAWPTHYDHGQDDMWSDTVRHARDYIAGFALTRRARR